MSPTTKGALIVYNNFIRKLFLKYRDTIDQGIDKIKEQTMKFGQQAKDFATNSDNIKTGMDLAQNIKTKLSNKE
mgnify:CR=1 FL=1